MMKKKPKIVKITSIVFFILVIIYFALHSAVGLSLLNKVNIKYDACVEEVCFNLNDGWLVIYNSDSLYGNIISTIYGNNIKSMSVVKMQGANVIEDAIYSKSLQKLDINKFEKRKKFNLGTATVLSSETTENGVKTIVMYLKDYDIFITSTTEDALFDIVLNGT